MKMMTKIAIAGSIVLAVAATASVRAQQSAMTFFITSEGPGKGADLGGLAGADAHCQKLAEAAGSKGKTWRAYLSTTEPGGKAGVNARDRIGKGPWQNAKGVVIATSVEDLHSDNNKIGTETALSEKGEEIPGSGGKPYNMHDILTGSDPQGLYSTAGGDTTCRNWTSSGEGSVIVGHHNRSGLMQNTRHMMSWNSSHGTPGCNPDALRKVGGAGLFYCFAAN
jgi:hypothetical protein